MSMSDTLSEAILDMEKYMTTTNNYKYEEKKINDLLIHMKEVLTVLDSPPVNKLNK